MGLNDWKEERERREQRERFPERPSQPPSKAIKIKRQLCQALIKQSGHDERRDYLGMSGIGDCSRKQYFNYVEGRKADDQLLWYSWTGYLHEGGLIKLFGRSKREVEVVADFDERFRGHVDLALTRQDLVEIKSTNWKKFQRIRYAGEPDLRHQYQVQMYMRHGGWERCFVVYIARDVPHKEFEGLPIFVTEVRPDKNRADRLDAKAKAILAAIDSRTPPKCDCGWCKD